MSNGSDPAPESGVDKLLVRILRYIQIYRYALDAEAIRFLHENPGESWKGSGDPR